MTTNREVPATLPVGETGSRTAPWLLLCYGLSGFTALAFEVLWARMLSVQFGISIFGVVVTVSAFMLGLGAGSLLGNSRPLTGRRALLGYACMEAMIAVYALCLPWLLRHTDTWLNSIAPAAGLAGWYLIQVSAMLILLTIPALAMGVAFPLIVRSGRGAGVGLGRLYGVNACGGALGALAPLVLMPAFGWAMAVWMVSLVALAVSLVAALLAVRNPPGDDGTEPRRPGPQDAAQRSSFITYAGIGACAMMLEIGWTRLFGMVMLRTEYVMAIILAVYLTGIGFGSLIARRLNTDVWYAVFACLTAAGGIATVWALPTVSSWLEQAGFASLAGASFMQGGVLALLTLPVTLCLGAWLPLLARRLGDQGYQGVRLYGVNSLGAALGSLLAGFALLPLLGTTATVALASLLLFVFGMMWTASRRVWVALPVLLLLAWPVRQLAPVRDLLPVAQADSRDLYRYEDALTITHVIEQRDGQRLLLTDLQRMDASTEPTAVALQKNQARLPLMFHAAADSILFLGLGTGITASGSLPYALRQRTAVELSQGAIDASRTWFRVANNDVTKELHIVRNDSRRYLKTTDMHFDVIVGDVFHPDLVGRSSLLSLEHFQLVRRRLTSDGVFVQWLALNQFDPQSLRIVMRTFQKVYPHNAVFVDGFRMALLGRMNDDTSLAQDQFRALSELDDSRRRKATGDEGRWTWLGRYWGKITLVDGPVQSEWRPAIEFSLPRARYNGDLNLTAVMTWLLGQRPAPEQAAADVGVGAADAEAFERAYIATGLSMRSWLALLNNNGAEADRLLRFAFQANPRDRWIGLMLADRMLASVNQTLPAGMTRRQALDAILRVRPDHTGTLRALWKLESATGNRDLAQQFRERLRKIAPYDLDSEKQTP